MSVSLETLALAKKFAKNYADGLIGSQGIFMYESRSSFPMTGEDKKLYVATDTGLMYRWDNTNATYDVVGGSEYLGKQGSITLSANWVGNNPYTQQAMTTGYTITAHTRVDLVPNNSVINQLNNDDVDSIYIENNNGVLTAYALGSKPTASLTIQAIFTEVN